nr:MULTISPECIES: hypothetical protein [unclassified Pseudomonas]
MNTDIAAVGARMIENSESLRKINLNEIKTSAESVSATYRQSHAITWLAIGLILGRTLLYAWRLTVSSTPPIAAVGAAKTIATGDPTQTLNTRGQDEAAQRLQAMQ